MLLGQALGRGRLPAAVFGLGQLALNFGFPGGHNLNNRTIEEFLEQEHQDQEVDNLSPHGEPVD